MTQFTIKKILNCLVRDSKNHDDLREMIRMTLENPDEVLWDSIRITELGWFYEYQIGDEHKTLDAFTITKLIQ